MTSQPLHEYEELRIGFTAAALKQMKFEPVKYVVPGYIAEGLTLFAGKPKLGKSWMALDIAIAVAGHRYTLGDVLCQPGDVLYLALEDNPRRLHKRMKKLLGDNDWPDRLTFECEWPLLDKGGVDNIRDWIEGATEPKLVIIDTLAKVRGSRDERDTSYDADYRVMKDLHSLASETGIAIVLVHHVRKMDADDPLDTVSGTTGLTGAADSILVLSKGANGVTLYGRGRDIEEIETAIRFNKNSCRWIAQGNADDVHRTDARTAVLNTLAQVTEALTPVEVADLTGRSHASIRQLLVRMWKDGEVEKQGRGKYCLSQGG